MNKSRCQICLSNQRPVKYSTRRIEACQWCVSILQRGSWDIEKARRYVYELSSKFIERPPSPPDENELLKMAKENVSERETFSKSIWRSLFSAKERELEIDFDFKNLLNTQTAQYRKEKDAYDRQRKLLIESMYNSIITGEFMPKEEYGFFRKRDIFDPYYHYWSPIGKGSKDALDGGDKDFLKVIRANQLGLLSKIKQSRFIGNEADRLRLKILKEDGFKCCLCGKTGRKLELHVHHIIPIECNGSNYSSNLITLCYTCHNKLHEGFKVTKHHPMWKTGGRFVAIDVETTGFSHVIDSLIEIAAVRFDNGNPIEKFQSFVNPETRIPPR